ncbi:MAG TPA: hypothetical protein VHY91_01270 [Pirellulales bacterium]|nr:hypothetical protein [Pirellulales bacterium]
MLGWRRLAIESLAACSARPICRALRRLLLSFAAAACASMRGWARASKIEKNCNTESWQ